MNNKLSVFTFLAVASLLLTACPSNEVMESKHISQSEIHQGYFVTYDAEEQLLTVNAEYRAAGPNGTTIFLSEPSDAICNGTEMKLETYLLGGAHYIYSKKGDNTNEQIIDVEFIDLDKKSYKNVMNIHTAEIMDHEIILKKDSTNRLSVKRHPLKNGEEMRLNLRGDSVNVELPFTTASVDITPENLKDFRKNEKVSLQVIRTGSGPLTNAASRGGNYSTSYYSPILYTTIR